MSNRVVSEERVEPPAAVWCHSKVTARAERSSLSPRPPGHAVTEYSSWHKHNARTDSMSLVSALLRVLAMLGRLRASKKVEGIFC